MNTDIPQLNLFFAWLWILVGFLSGMVMGLCFHKEDWLGGYGSFKRRLYRLAHISFFGLGLINMLFYFTARIAPLDGSLVATAGWAFVIGAATMPVCCATMAHQPKAQALFAVPVLSLIAGAVCALKEIASL